MNDPEQVAKKRAELDEMVAELKEAHDLYAASIKEMLR